MEGLDLQSQNQNVFKAVITIEEFKKQTYENEDREPTTTSFWLLSKSFDYEGKFLLDKNIVIDLKNKNGLYEHAEHFEKEGFKGDIENLKSFLKSKCKVKNDFLRVETDQSSGYYYFLKNDNVDFNNYNDGDLRVSVKFVIELKKKIFSK